MKESEIVPLVESLAAALIAKRWHIATAESCTGGWIAKCCTDMAGSSAWFDRGFITYSNESKIELLGVSPETLNLHHAVSYAVAREMAEGARRNSGCEVAVAVTGIAGPDGGSEDKPVGRVWFAWAMSGRESWCERKQFSGDRASVRLATVAHALRSLLEQIA